MLRKTTFWLTTMAPVLALMCIGASCSGGESEGSGASAGSGNDHPSGQQQAGQQPATRTNIDHIDGVDVSELTSAERRIFVDVVNDQLSPCGEPTSVARCAQETHSCRTCVPAARYVVRLISEGFERSEIEEMYGARFGRDSRVEIDIENHPMRGAPMGQITIVEFSDFECPYCGRAHPIIQEALREFEGQVRVVFFNYPLPGHPHAMPAARAAVAAGNQGKFWEMHDILFDHQQALEEEDIDGYAREIGLDMERFHADLRSPETQRRVEADREVGHGVDVQGTPTLYINGRHFAEAPTSLAAYLREELEQ
ncbi:MAG: thioredoxin domain-containing protein [Deltaproteobacteria bacterium]|nr:thioredoxin domain-containing protein [Deltaproteobacteria bacterium]